MTTSEIVERLGLWCFGVMSTLILICIMLGFYAVYDSYTRSADCIISTPYDEKL